MKVILFTYDLSTIGGIETSFFQLAQYLKLKVSSYTLREKTEASVEEAMAMFKGMVKGKQILKVRRSYWDIKVRKQRGIGEVFAADKERAKELLSNENNIVAKLGIFI